MSRAILMSIRPEWTAKILNGEKTIEIRKRFPKDYVGWVYLYCMKGELLQAHWGIANNGKDKHILYGRKCKDKDFESPHTENGKVVCRFYCDNVEEIEHDLITKENFLEIGDEATFYLCDKGDMSPIDLDKYLEDTEIAYAIHISQLEVFDRPKELSEFNLTKAPQNYCYIEVEK